MNTYLAISSLQYAAENGGGMESKYFACIGREFRFYRTRGEERAAEFFAVIYGARHGYAHMCAYEFAFIKN